MPAFPRSHYVEDGEIGCYHAWSRCVQRAFLCGFDPYTGEDYNHRRDWIEKLFEYQASLFAIDLCNYNILTNHEHLLVRTRPDISALWSDEEVAWRWTCAWPNWDGKAWQAEPDDEKIRRLLAEPDLIQIIRANLAKLSWFMARVKEPIAKLANAEMERTGHFFDGRYKCRRLDDAPAVLTCSVYLDLNQLAAGMATSLETSEFSAIQRRLNQWKHEQAQASLEEFHKKGRADLKLELDDVMQLLNCDFLSPISANGPLILLDAHGSAPLVLPAEPHILSLNETLQCESAPSELIMEDALTEAAVMESSVATIETVNPNEVVETAAAESIEEVQVREPSAAISAHEISATAADLPVAAADQPTTSTAPADADHGQAAVEQPVGNGKRKRARLSKDDRSAKSRTYEIHRRLKARLRARASDNPYLDIPPEQYFELVTWSAQQLSSQLETPAAVPESLTALLSRMGINAEMWMTIVKQFEKLFRSVVGAMRSLEPFLQRTGRSFVHGIQTCRGAFT